MSTTHITPTHPSHHPPNTIPAPADAAQSAPQPSEESAPFTEVVGRGKKARNTQSKRVSPQQTTLTFAGAPSPSSASSSLVVSVDIASRAEETKECVVASARVEQRSAGRATAPAATAISKETGRLDQLASSSRATKHSSPSLSNARSADTASRAAQAEPFTSPSTPQLALLCSASPSLTLTSSSRPNGAEHEDDRMRDIAAAKRARELYNAHPVPVTPVTTANGGFVHPARQLLMSDGDSTGTAVDDCGKEEGDPSSGQDKRRRTTPPRSTATSSSPCAIARRDTPPTVEEFNKVVAELQASMKESSDLRARLEQLEQWVEALLPASQTTTGVSPLAPCAAVPASDNQSATAPPAAILSTAAMATSKTVSATPTLPRSQPARQYSLAEPKAALLSSLSLSPYSSTDLMLDVCLPPLTIRMARGRFPNHATQPANHRMGIVNLLQDAHGIQLHPLAFHCS